MIILIKQSLLCRVCYAMFCCIFNAYILRTHFYYVWEFGFSGISPFFKHLHFNPNTSLKFEFYLIWVYPLYFLVDLGIACGFKRVFALVNSRANLTNLSYFQGLKLLVVWIQILLPSSKFTLCDFYVNSFSHPASIFVI